MKTRKEICELYKTKNLLTHGIELIGVKKSRTISFYIQISSKAMLSDSLKIGGITRG
ncbi:hypothetical protein JMN23_25915 [Bacillus sp. RHFB]|nr:hypothetical protein [Bacillus sp. RHFB]